jgi:predicted RNase H-like HicB family nuclease
MEIKNMNMKGRKLKAVIETGNDGLYSIYIPSISGLYGAGETEVEAKQELQGAIDMAIEHVEETGEWGDYLPLKGEYEIEYTYDLSGFFKTFNFFDVSTLANTLGLNPSLLRRYKNGITKASGSQKKKIEDGIHQIAKRLSVARF